MIANILNRWNMKADLKVILCTTVALMAFPTLLTAQTVFQPFPPTPQPSIAAITVTPSANNVAYTDLGHGLTVISICRDGGQPNSLVAMAFHNSGVDAATINYLYSDGTTVTANGQVLQALYGEFQAIYNFKRVEGQFIFANSVGNTTVNLHAFDGGQWCEVRGTAIFAPNPPPPLVNK
jgi:hypothetical protein